MPATPAHVLALLFLVQVAFASLAVVGKVTVEAVPWQSLVLLRTLGASLVFALVAVARGEAQLPPPGARLAALRLGFLGVFVNQAFFLAGLRRTSPVNASVLVATIPLFTALFAIATRREPFRPRFAAGTAVALAGLALVVRPERVALGAGHVAGDVLVVINCAAYGVYLALARDLAPRWGGAAVVRWAFFAALLFAIPLGLGPTLTAAPTWSPAVWWALGYILLVPTAFTYGANALALGSVPASVVSVFVYLQPVMAVAMAVTVGRDLADWLRVSFVVEPLTARTILGGITVLAGVSIATLRRIGSSTERSAAGR